jgi:lipid-A-disaccharide synthase
MVIAGEASGDTLAAELVTALRAELLTRLGRPSPDSQPPTTTLEPVFFGAGGPRMAAAGIELCADMTAHAVVGFTEVLKQLRQFRRLFRQLLALAITRQPDAIILVDYAGFNRRFAAAVRRRLRARRGLFSNWAPRLVYYVSPQVWASRPGRADQLARDVDLLLSIFPFERAWYAQRTPRLQVEFVGHPLIDRHRLVTPGPTLETGPAATPDPAAQAPPLVLLLPGSRRQELQRHLPVMTMAARGILTRQTARFRVVLPSAGLAAAASPMVTRLPGVEIQAGNLAGALADARLAIASSGTVTMECALFQVPAVVIYKMSWPTYLIARRLIQVPHIAMPNLLAGDAIYPELVQGAATPQRIADQALSLMTDPNRRRFIQERLARVIESLGPPGACGRAARTVADLLVPEAPPGLGQAMGLRPSLRPNLTGRSP